MFIKIILSMAIAVVFATISFGFYSLRKKQKNSALKLKKYLRLSVATCFLLVFFALMLMIPESVFASSELAKTEVNGLGLLAVALSTGLATIGAGYAVGAVGSSALGAVSEDPQILGKTLIFVGLAEGIAIYGIIISILILGKL